MKLGRTIVAISALVIGLACASATADSDTQVVRGAQLSKKIGPPRREAYRGIQDARDWRNPYLVVRQDDVEVIAMGLPGGRTTVAFAQLEQTLIALPVTAWPYGTVVALQGSGIRPAGGNEKAATPNLALALTTLRRLDVLVEDWPS